MGRSRWMGVMGRWRPPEALEDGSTQEQEDGTELFASTEEQGSKRAAPMKASEGSCTRRTGSSQQLFCFTTSSTRVSSLSARR